MCEQQVDIPSLLFCGVKECATAARHSYVLGRAECEEETGFPAV